MNKQEYQKVRSEIIAEIEIHINATNFANEIADHILSHPSICIKDPDQSKPENPYHPKAKDPPFHECVICREAYAEAQEGMKDWVKVIKEKG